MAKAGIGGILTEGWGLTCAGMGGAPSPWLGFSGGDCPNLPDGNSQCKPSYNGSIRPSSPGYVWPPQCKAVTDKLTAYVAVSASPTLFYIGCGGTAGPGCFCGWPQHGPDWLLGVQVVGSETKGDTPDVAAALKVLNQAVLAGLSAASAW